MLLWQGKSSQTGSDWIFDHRECRHLNLGFKNPVDFEKAARGLNHMSIFSRKDQTSPKLFHFFY